MVKCIVIVKNRVRERDKESEKRRGKEVKRDRIKRRNSVKEVLEKR